MSAKTYTFDSLNDNQIKILEGWLSQEFKLFNSEEVTPEKDFFYDFPVSLYNKYTKTRSFLRSGSHNRAFEAYSALKTKSKWNHSIPLSDVKVFKLNRAYIFNNAIEYLEQNNQTEILAV